MEGYRRLYNDGYRDAVDAAGDGLLTGHAGGRDHARLLWGLMVLELSLP